MEAEKCPKCEGIVYEAEGYPAGKTNKEGPQHTLEVWIGSELQVNEKVIIKKSYKIPSFNRFVGNCYRFLGNPNTDFQQFPMA